MKLLLKHPVSGRPDLMLTLTTLVVAISSLKFLLDGVSLVVYGQTITMPHTDGGAYAAFLTPVLGAHGFISSRPTSYEPISSKVENPDEAS